MRENGYTFCGIPSVYSEVIARLELFISMNAIDTSASRS